jgi:DNA-binding response OmpR family regulator
MPRNMLVVDDDRTTRDVLRAIFGQMGWEVDVAATVEDGLAHLDPPPDALILDLSLPDGSGTEILRRIRRDRLPTRVAVTTGHDPDSLGHVAELRPEALLQKPIDVDELCRVWGE